MGDNQEVLEVSSPTQELDLSPLINILEEVKSNQGEIIEQNKILLDYFVPTEEELQRLQDEELQKLQKEEKIIEEENKIKEEKEQYQLDYDNEVLEQLTLLNENISNVGINTEYSNNYSYLLLLLLLLAGICCFIYKIIKKFIY